MIGDFIEQVPLEIGRIEELIQPQDDLQEGDQVRGELPPDLQKLYTLWKLTGKDAGALENELTWGGAGPDLLGRVREKKAKAAVLNYLFWIAVQDLFDLWGLKEPLALRTGFRVVTTKIPEMPSFFRFDIGGGPNG